MEPRGGAPGQAAQPAAGSPLRATVCMEAAKPVGNFN